jgi:hypothetical protein
MQQLPIGTAGASTGDTRHAREVNPRMRKAAANNRAAKRKRKEGGHGRTTIQDVGNQEQSVRLFRTPPPRAVSPYMPHNEVADRKLRELIFHYTTVVTVHTVTSVGPRREVSYGKHHLFIRCTWVERVMKCLFTLSLCSRLSPFLFFADITPLMLKPRESLEK